MKRVFAGAKGLFETTSSGIFFSRKSFSLFQQLGHVLVLFLDPPVDVAGLVVQTVEDFVVFIQLVVEAGGQDLQPGQASAHLVQIPVEDVIDGCVGVLLDAAAGSKTLRV